MDGDLSLSQSLGGLRIANPDNLSPNSVEDDPMQHAQPESASDDPGRAKHSCSQPVLPAGVSLMTPLSLDFNPGSFALETSSPNGAYSPVEKPPRSPPKEQPSYTQRQSNRLSIPLTYQDQQQAQFPQYPTMVPQNQRHPSASARPVSTIYTQTVNANVDVPTRGGSYRLRNESSRSSIQSSPQRKNSRDTSAAMQAGVLTREGVHSARSYRQGQQAYNGNAPLPPRRSSRGINGGHANGPAEHHSMNNSGSPYAVEGGPLASSEEWQERGAAVGIRAEIDANGRPVLRHVKKGVKDFHFGRTLGEGSYSTVMAATDRQTLQEYAIKVLDKKHIIKEKKVKYVNIEKDTLNKLTDHPGVVRLYYTFQDMQSLYFVLDLASGGELLGVLKRMTTFDEECTRFYGAQILDTIDYMHSRGVIHRDLKPENVLLDDQMHVKVTDFGTAKILNQGHGKGEANIDRLQGCASNDRASSFVGTAEYVSPELLTDKNACKASDLWAFGCIIYQLLAGRPPFKAANEYLTFQKITSLQYEFPYGFPGVAKDLVERLLVLDPTRRLTIDNTKNHEFFDGIIWGPGLWKQKAPRLKSFVPPSQDLTMLNGHGAGTSDESSLPPNITPAHSTAPTRFDGVVSNGPPKIGPRVITELPPPSQLDIEWSPVLTKNNERILKLGNLVVLSSPATHSPNTRNGVSNVDAETPKKFSRFFGGNAPKKRQRLVMVTSSGRIIMVAAGGEEKKTKTELSLLDAGCTWKTAKDSKGLTFWSIDTVTASKSIDRQYLANFREARQILHL